MGGGGAAGGIPYPFPQPPSTVCGAHPYAILQSLVHQRGCAWGGHPGSDCQGCGGACSASLSRLLQPSVCGVENLGCPVIDLSTLNRFVDVLHFRMETIQSVLLSVRQGDWMTSIDLKEAYLQVPIHPESRPFLRFVAHGRTYQFTALCFGLSMAPQVFSRVMAPVSAILHSWGIRMR